MPEAARHQSSAQPYSLQRARGYSWPPFEQGNLKAVRHGVHSQRIISAKTAEVREELIAQCPWVVELDLVTVELYCRAAARHYLLHDYFMGVAEGTFEAAPSKDRPLTGVAAMPAYLLAEMSAAAGKAGKYGHQLGLSLLGWVELVKRLGWERSVEIGLVPASLAERR